MGRKFIFSIIVITTLLFSCGTRYEDPNLLRAALASTHSKIRRVMDSLAQYELQVLYTKIDRIRDSVIFTDYNFQVNDSNYFYPASTVKILTAVLTLEKLNEMDSLDLYTHFYIEGDSLETTFANEISKIFAVSDNEANNRLLEFLGQDRINKSLKDKGIAPVRISHRLSTENAFEVTTRPLIVYLNDTTITWLKPSMNKPAKPLALNSIKKGKGYYEENNLINEPFDFSLKNYFPLRAQNAVLKRIIFPEQFPKNERFNLSPNQHRFLLKAMSDLPKNIGYNEMDYYDGYCKFFMFGDTRDTIPKYLKIYNKVGNAYGTITDFAYIKDNKNNVEFMLTATLLANKNGVFNDNIYEYEKIGLPFLAQLGREIYILELAKKQRK
ncbi:serine hydrolase [Arenibacter sp. F20364]|uniref:serine hydrolase n=1 Tax=Arenibacter sp. F20364 TaxID=2926415 RepID=UPI001FF44F54|nr:serine hydrolase [Arenibacter sp. F20364]MCK0192290.1 class A beta-lactamase-related serine hydrolase [Arenibacter sp. F20364]